VNVQLKVQGRINRSQGATVTIDRDRLLVHVRPKGERRLYTLTLETVAEMVVSRVVKDELGKRKAMEG
jgi:hypothetical protein